MTFLLTGLARVSSSANELSLVTWSYKSSADTMATIVASAYFNDKITAFAVGDVILIEASDTHRQVRVTSVTTNVTVETYETAEGSLDLTEGSLYIGDSSNKATSISVETDTQILVGNGTTATSVAMSGDVTMTNAGVVTIETDAVTTAKILDDAVTAGKILADSVTTNKILDANVTTAKILDANVTEAKVAPNTLTATVLANVADANTSGGVPVIFRIDTAGGATANTDVVMDHKVKIIDAWVLNLAAGTASDTITLVNGTNAISDAVDISGGDTTIARIGTMDDAYQEIAATDTLRVTETDGGGSDSPATSVYVLAIRVA